MAAPTPSQLDFSQVLQGSYDEANGRLRVKTEAVVVNGAIEVAIDASYDNIAIKNPSSNNVLAINTDGSINVKTPSSTSGFSNIGFSGLVAVTTTSTTLLTANAGRKYAHIVNNTNNVIYVQFGGAAVFGQGIKLLPNAFFTISGYELFLGLITGVSSSTINLDILEGI